MVKPEERIAEWDPRQRYRPYRVHGRGQDWVACAGTPGADGVGVMLETLTADGEINAQDRIGVLDTAPWERGQPGRWLINPHT